jgi:hypothetical protein
MKGKNSGRSGYRKPVYRLVGRGASSVGFTSAIGGKADIPRNDFMSTRLSSQPAAKGSASGQKQTSVQPSGMSALGVITDLQLSARKSLLKASVICFYGSAHGKLVTGILALIPEFENDIRREQQMDGINKAHERGVRFGPSSRH